MKTTAEINRWRDEHTGERCPIPIEMIGMSQQMEAVRRLIRKVARHDVAVLIQGETGTGKELAARILHDLSPRRHEPFVAVNCAALTESLIESELFGHERGAFTDAKERREGKFEYAAGGTLFLDEIGSLSLDAQSKFLRVLQEREFERVGSNRSVAMSARIIAATNEDLVGKMEDRTFRSDLYYRLNVVGIAIPPLRDRKEDIPTLIKHFLDKHSTKMEVPNLNIHPLSIAALQDRPWPGNARELENTMIRILVEYGGMGDLIHLDAGYLGLLNGKTAAAYLDRNLSYHATIRAMERDILADQLSKHYWNISETANAIGMHRNTLMNKMNALSIKYGEKEA